jgi:hypothetical protein
MNLISPPQVEHNARPAGRGPTIAVRLRTYLCLEFQAASERRVHCRLGGAWAVCVVLQGPSAVEEMNNFKCGTVWRLLIASYEVVHT